jgi:ribA/ribD-fused uncharacterized protein
MPSEIRFYRTRELGGFMSNFWVGNPILFRGHVFKTSEHLYQALKVAPVDVEAFAKIRDAKTAMEAASLGRKAAIREDWDDVKDFAMRLALLLKFEDQEARMQLLDTGDAELVENTTSSGDVYWGRTDAGVGRNRLGELLMEMRAFYRQLIEATAREEAAEVAQLQSEIEARLLTKKYKVVVP